VVDTTAGGGHNDISQTLAYDQRGNRRGTGYTVNSDNRLTTAPNGLQMTYDNEGNLKTMSNKRFEWDHRNRLTRVSIGNADWVTYEYDAFNRMVKRSQSGTFNTTYFAYDEGINPLLQWESNDIRLSLSHRYLWSDSVDELLADEQFLAGMTAPDTKWAMSDHQGTIKDIVDYNPATGVSSVERHRKYDPFGDRRGAALPTDIVFGYTGKYFDDMTGLQNNWNRWYDPKQGRFISQDPIGFAAGDANLYRYTGNSPTNRTDPSGLDWEWQWEWHHLLPQAIFGNKNIPGIDINASEYGYMLRGIDHRGEGVGVHALGWDKQWRDWLANQANDGVEVTKELVDKRLAEMLKEFDLPNKGFAAKFGYEMREQAYKAAHAMWMAGRPIASKALSKSFLAAREAVESVSTKIPKVKVPVKGGGGIVGFFVGIFGGALFGSQDPVGDAIDGLVLTSPMGDSEWRPDPYGWWSDYQRELDKMQADRDAYQEYLDNCPTPPDDFWGPFPEQVRIR
jgi:RHS repeat-associated protein